MGSTTLVSGGFKPVLKKYNLRVQYIVDETNGNPQYVVNAIFPSGKYSDLDYTPILSNHRFYGWDASTDQLPYDSKVEYLENSTRAVIDTGVAITTDLKIEMDFMPLTYTSGSYIMGNVPAWDNRRFCLFKTTNYLGFHVGVNCGTYPFQENTWVHFYMGNDTWYLRSANTTAYTNKSYAASNLSANTGNVYLFARSDTANSDRYVGLRIRSCKIWNGNTLVRDFIPVRSSGVGYLYDKVSGQLFGNIVSGQTFTYGSDVPEEPNIMSSDTIRYDVSTVKALWQNPISVTFDATTNGGTMPNGWVAPNYYEGQPYETLPQPTKTNETFIGWYDSWGIKITKDTPAISGKLIARFTIPVYDTSFEVTTTSSYRNTGIYTATSKNTSNPTIVDWGDGSTDVVYGNVSQLVHTYSSNGTFTVRVNNNISSFALSANNSTWYGTTSQNRYTVKKVTALSPNITSLPTYAFNYCSAMTDALLPSGISAVPNYCFNYCQALKGITIPSNYTSIGQYAFYRCGSSSFTSVTIPAAITTINTHAFEYCNYLHPVFEGSSTALTLGTYAFSRCGSQGSSFTIDMSMRKVTIIPNYCFQYCRYLSGFVWPQNVTSVGQNAFQYCFYHSGSTGTMTVPEGVTSIGNSAFNGCQYLTAITLPSTLTTLGTYVFSGDGRLATITVNRSSAPTIGNGIFGTTTGTYTGRNSYSAGTNKLYVPAGATGYTSSYWGSVLLDSTKCGFTKEEMQ